MKLRYKAAIKGIALSLSLALGAMWLPACTKDDGTGYIFKYDLPANPRTLDPQTATDSSAYEIIANMFEGLLKIDNDGTVQPAAAESYTVSDDGLVYSFTLREDIFWTDGDEFEAQCTAKDYVFAFQRLFRPSTKSKTAGDFLCIKNAEKINKGEITDLTELGVKAEGDYKLTITLEAPNPSFAVMLTTAPAMPCNEKYYNSTEGRYGLYADTIASNGAFYMYRWSYDPYSTDNNTIIMRANKKNSRNGEVSPYGLNFFIEEEDSYQNFLDEKNHIYITSGSEAVELIEQGYEYSENETRIWGILFNAKSNAFKNENLRKALASGINREEITLNSIGYGKAKGIIPNAIKIGSESYRELAGGDSLIPYNSDEAKNKMNEALDSLEKNSLSGLTLYTPDDETIFNYVSDISQKWQSELNFYCNVKKLSKSEYESALISGNFDFIVADVSGNTNSPYAYLTSFISGGSGNYSGYENANFNTLLNDAETASTAKSGAVLFKKAEDAATDSGIFIPLLNQSEYAFFKKDCRGIVYNSFTKTVIFKEAKQF